MEQEQFGFKNDIEERNDYRTRDFYYSSKNIMQEHRKQMESDGYICTYADIVLRSDSSTPILTYYGRYIKLKKKKRERKYKDVLYKRFE